MLRVNITFHMRSWCVDVIVTFMCECYWKATLERFTLVITVQSFPALHPSPHMFSSSTRFTAVLSTLSATQTVRSLDEKTAKVSIQTSKHWNNRATHLSNILLLTSFVLPSPREFTKKALSAIGVLLIPCLPEDRRSIYFRRALLVLGSMCKAMVFEGAMNVVWAALFCFLFGYSCEVVFRCNLL